jgi:hypothetical protein
LDETWVDTNHTASHQWTSSDPSKNQQLPLEKEQRLVVLHAGYVEKDFYQVVILFSKVYALMRGATTLK